MLFIKRLEQNKIFRKKIRTKLSNNMNASGSEEKDDKPKTMHESKSSSTKKNRIQKMFSHFHLSKTRAKAIVYPIQTQNTTKPFFAKHTRYSSSISTGSNTVDSSENDVVKIVRNNVVGSRCLVSSPFGRCEMVYADYTASGRCLKLVEDYMVDVVAPMYANTHTEASMTGAQTTHLREEARDIICRALHAPKDKYAVLFTGTGSTGAIDKLFRAIGFGIPEYADKRWKLSKTLIPKLQRPVVFISHMEHHSNELIWRESIARCVVIEEDQNGQPDLRYLENMLIRFKKDKVPMIGSFTAGSNVTGIRTPTRTIAELLHKYGAYAFFDYAGVGPYINIDVYGNSDNDNELSSMDAVFLSPHKFIGGPGSAGVLVARRDLFAKAFDVPTTKPSTPGGGTVSFVSEYISDYANDCEVREDAGTPGIMQCIRAGLAFRVKDMVGSGTIEALEAQYCTKALESWESDPDISLVGSDRMAYFDTSQRVSIISFNILSPVPAIDTSARYDHMIGTPGGVFPVACTWHAQTRSSRNSNAHTIRSFQEDDTLSHNHSHSYNHNYWTKVPLHYNFVIALLNDVYGIQGRGGCSCTGPYGHRLFGINGQDGKSLSDRIQYLSSHKGYHSFKFGWARINLNYFIGEHEVNFIIAAVHQIALHGWKLLPYYIQDLHNGQYYHRRQITTTTNATAADHDGIGTQKIPLQLPFSLYDFSLKGQQCSNKPQQRYYHHNDTTTDTNSTVRQMAHYKTPKVLTGERSPSSYRNVLEKAMRIYDQAIHDFVKVQPSCCCENKKKNTRQTSIQDFTEASFPPCAQKSDIWWLLPSEAYSELVRQHPPHEDI